MNKTIISLSIISLLAGCGGGGGSSTPDDKPPTPPASKIDFPLKGASFDAAKLNSTTISIKEFSSSFMEDSALVETNYEKSNYRALEADEVAHINILNQLENEAKAQSFFSVSTSEYSDAKLTQLEDQDISYGAMLANTKFVTFINDIALDQQTWELPDFIAASDIANTQHGSDKVMFKAELSNLLPNQIQRLLEDTGLWVKEYESVTHCAPLTATRIFYFMGSEKEKITVKGKVIETIDANVIDKVSGTCYLGLSGDSFSFDAYRNNDPTSLRVWLNPTFGIVKAIEKNDSRKETYLIELTDFSLKQ